MPSEPIETVDQTRATATADPGAAEIGIQPAGFLIVMSLDWIVQRASENVDDFLGESHVTLIDEPLGRFVQAQALHDLRNLFSRLSGSTGIGRAYRIRLSNDRPRCDIAFQVSDGRVVLEAVPSPDHGFGEALGSVGGLVDGLAEYSGSALLEGAARRLRALTGCDRSVVRVRDDSAERSATSARENASAPASEITDLPPILADAQAAPVPLFPRKPNDQSVARALLRSPSPECLKQLGERGIQAVVNVPYLGAGKPAGVLQCESRSPRPANFEVHAAAELFGQMLALRLELDCLRSGV
jgi:light-regulated signal transduction histidine kinase (bacteriophytochrome)